ncbi:MAG: FAD-dependent oxidoreductase [Rhodobacteraceae bacterium]|nr:FAD-dependent oxidoreductase [Paracoccaceae bacterium]
MKRRAFLGSSLAATTLMEAAWSRASIAQETVWDFIVVGAGTAGLPAAIFAADRGAKVLVIEVAPTLGGTLTIAGGEICGAGTKTQARFGLEGDHPDKHFADVMRITDGLADPNIVRMTVDTATAMIDWIDDRGWDCRPGHFLDGASPGRPGYSTRRYYQAEGQGKAISDLLARELGMRTDQNRVTVLTGTKASELLTSDSGSVEGVRATADDRSFAYRGRHVLITTGGYSMNPDMFMNLVKVPAYVNDSYPYSLGDGLTMAANVGAALRGMDLHRSGSGSILTTDKWPAAVYARFETRPQVRAPWEIWVNDYGTRYVNEESPNNTDREQALLRQPRLRYTLVFDDAILNTAPIGIPTWTRDKLGAQFNVQPMFYKADSVEELAKRADLDSKGLVETIAAYNAGIANGSDPFGRQHRPAPIAKAPYYAIAQFGDSATSSAGISVNAGLQAVRADGTPIPNLYAAGEALGSGATLGKAFCPGMMITPAMTGGRWLGLNLPLDA